MLQKCEGIVIRTTRYGESNLILTIYSREFGKIAMMARGAKKTNSRHTAISQLFTYGSYLYQSGNGLGTLQQGEVISSMRFIREDLVKTSYASYIVDLLDQSTDEKEPNPFLFELLYQSLQLFDEGADLDIVKNIFEMKMLPVLGLRPVLDRCVNCGKTEGSFSFSFRENGFLCHRCLSVDRYCVFTSQATVRLLRLFYYFDLNRLGTISVKDETKKELQKIIYQYYDDFSGVYLKSRKFLDQLDKMESWLPKKED